MDHVRSGNTNTTVRNPRSVPGFCYLRGSRDKESASKNIKTETAKICAGQSPYVPEFDSA